MNILTLKTIVVKLNLIKLAFLLGSRLSNLALRVLYRKVIATFVSFGGAFCKGGVPSFSFSFPCGCTFLGKFLGLLYLPVFSGSQSFKKRLSILQKRGLISDYLEHIDKTPVPRGNEGLK